MVTYGYFPEWVLFNPLLDFLERFFAGFSFFFPAPPAAFPVPT
jgi:hypothetical protein